MSTGIIIQLAIVNIAVVAAVLYLIRRAVRNRKHSCECGCERPTASLER